MRLRVESELKLKAHLKKGSAFQKVSDIVKRAKLRREPPQTDKFDGSVFGDTQK